MHHPHIMNGAPTPRETHASVGAWRGPLCRALGRHAHLVATVALQLTACASTATDTATHTDDGQRDTPSPGAANGPAGSDTGRAGSRPPDDANDDSATGDDAPPDGDAPAVDADAALDCSAQLSEDVANAVRAIFSSEPEGPISEARLALVTRLSLRDARSLAGISCLPNLKELSVGGAVELDLSPLRNLALTGLRLSGLTAPSGLEALATLSLHKLELIRVESLTQLLDPTIRQSPAFSGTLTTLRIEESSLTELGWLAQLRALQELFIPVNAISDLEPLRALDSLVRLDAARNAIEGLSPLSDLPRLEVVHVENNQITSLEGVSGEALLELYAARNAITTLDGFASASLEVLDVDYNAIDAAPDLDALPQLKRLYLRGNAIPAFIAPAEHGLELLWLTGNPLSSASGLPPLGALINVALGETPLSDLSPLAGLTALEQIDLHDTPVSDLSPLSALPRVNVLNLSDTAVRSLDPIVSWTLVERQCGALHLEDVQLDSPEVAIAFCNSGWYVLGSVECTSKACGDPI